MPTVDVLAIGADSREPLDVRYLSAFERRQANISERLSDNRECPPNKVPEFLPCSCVAPFVR